MPFGPPPKITRDDLIEVLRRNLEPHWIEGLLDDPSSLSLFEGAISVLLRIQDAVDENFSIGSFILTAPGRTPATSTVRLNRPSGAEVTVETDRRFLDDRGAIWRPSAAFTIPLSGGSQTVDVPIETERTGYFLNSFEPLTYRILDALPDPTLIVLAGADPATGGKTPFLDQHGKERRVFRAAGETDAQYQNRIVFLEDQVSPKAIAETVLQVLDEFPASQFIADLIFRHGLRTVREPFQDTAQPAQLNLIGADIAFLDDVQPIPVASPIPDPGGTFADDLNGHHVRDRDDACAWFDVLLPTIPNPADDQLFFDDGLPGPAGSRGFFDDPEFGYADLPAADTALAPVAALADELDRRRGGCVRFRILVGEEISSLRHPPLGTLAQVGTYTDADGNVADVDLTDAVRQFDGDDDFALTTTGEATGDALDAGDLLYTLAAIPAPISISHVMLRARARQKDVSIGTDPILQFLVKPTTAGVPERVGPTFAIDNETYRQFEILLEKNPINGLDWTLADIAGAVDVGIANVAGAAVATEELRVSELTLEIVANFG